MPQVRALTEDQGKSVDELLSMKCSIKEIQAAARRKYGKEISRKDLHNRRSKQRESDGDTLNLAVKLLTETYGNYRYTVDHLFYL